MTIKNYLKTTILTATIIMGFIGSSGVHADSFELLETDNIMLIKTQIRNHKAALEKAKAEAEALAAAKAAEEAANPYVSRNSEAIANAQLNTMSANMYPIGQCTWGVKELAPWVYTYWGNATDWAINAVADGFSVGTTPVVGAIAVWTSTDGGYGHVAYVTDVENETSIQVLEANIGGNPTIANYRDYFNPTATAEGIVSYIYPPAQS